MTNLNSLTPAEKIFAERMLHHFMRGKSPVECAEAVLADDARLVGLFCGDTGAHWFGDHLGAKALPSKKSEMVSALSAHVYKKIRQ